MKLNVILTAVWSMILTYCKGLTTNKKTQALRITTTNSSECVGTKIYLSFNGTITKAQTITFRIIRHRQKLVIVSVKPSTSKFRCDGIICGFSNGTLIINVANRYDGGEYEREVRNGGTCISRHVLQMLTVPLTLPEFSIKTRPHDPHYKKVTCDPPKHIDIMPAAKVIMKDSHGDIQNGLSVTIRDDTYQCCIIGEAISRCWPDNKPNCVEYNFKDIAKENVITKCRGEELYHLGLYVLMIILLIAVGLVLFISYKKKLRSDCCCYHHQVKANTKPYKDVENYCSYHHQVKANTKPYKDVESPSEPGNTSDQEKEEELPDTSLKLMKSDANNSEDTRSLISYKSTTDDDKIRSEGKLNKE